MSKAMVVSRIQNAVQNGLITLDLANSIEEELDPIALAGCHGVNPDDIDSEEATLVCAMLDGSGSMADFSSDVISSYNDKFLDSIKGAKNADSIYISTWVFSENIPGYAKLIHSYLPASQCPNLTKSDYSPDGGTPLLQAVNYGLTGLFDYGNVLNDSGTRVKRIMVVLSDGEHNVKGISSAIVKKFSKEMLKQENCVLAYVFFAQSNLSDQDADTMADKCADEIGFPKHNRLTSKLGKSEIRRILGTISSSVITASQSKVSSGSLSSVPFFNIVS